MNNENRIEQKSLLENAPSIIIVSTAVFFLLSFSYNLLYFKALDLEIGQIPLTLTDHTLTAQIYFFFVIACTIGVIHGLINSAIEKKEMKENNNSSPISIINRISPWIGVLGLFILLYKLKMLEFSWITLHLFLFFLLGGFLVLNENLKQFIWIFAIGIVLLSLFVQTTIVDSFKTKGAIIKINQDDYFLMRTFEKGFLVRDQDFNLGFKYLDSDVFLLYPITEERKDYFYELADIERETKDKSTDNKNKEDVDS